MIAYTTLALIVLTFRNKVLFSISVVLFLFLLYFYRYEPFVERFDNNTLVSPCEGKVIELSKLEDGRYYVAIFLSPIDRHYQIYPINGTVVKREYDRTGKFEIVMDINKSRFNEKRIHYIEANNGINVTMYQIAGMLPRMITSSEQVPEKVQAGEYLGMMKFGSRVDLLFTEKCDLKIKKGQRIHIGDIIATFSGSQT